MSPQGWRDEVLVLGARSTYGPVDQAVLELSDLRMRAEARRYPADAKNARVAGSSEIVERLEPTARGDPQQSRNRAFFLARGLPHENGAVKRRLAAWRHARPVAKVSHLNWH